MLYNRVDEIVHRRSKQHKHYQITLYYDKNDETEMVIRILSFGIWIKVLSPEDFRRKLLNRIEKQVLLVSKEVE